MRSVGTNVSDPYVLWYQHKQLKIMEMSRSCYQLQSGSNHKILKQQKHPDHKYLLAGHGEDENIPINMRIIKSYVKVYEKWNKTEFPYGGKITEKQIGSEGKNKI